ncbi:MAG: hypothetical protein HW412_1278 [Bacteroidetes bacterium]|nr:hypothetical protein [Bacteroidota bacterium]
MNAAKLLASPLWFPFWFVWNVLAFLGRTLWFFITFSVKAAIILLAIFGLIVWLWW